MVAINFGWKCINTVIEPLRGLMFNECEIITIDKKNCSTYLEFLFTLTDCVFRINW